MTAKKKIWMVFFLGPGNVSGISAALYLVYSTKMHIVYIVCIYRERKEEDEEGRGGSNNSIMHAAI